MAPDSDNVRLWNVSIAALVLAVGFAMSYYAISYHAGGSITTAYLLGAGFLAASIISLYLVVGKGIDKDDIALYMFYIGIMGLLVAGYQVYEHYFITSSVCDLSTTFTCSVVTESRFGEFPQRSGIALSLYGMVWWAGLMLLSGDRFWNLDIIPKNDFYTLVWNAIGTLTIIPLLAIELYILPQEIGQIAICPFCTVQHLLIALLFALSFPLLDKPLKQHLTDIFIVEGE